METDPKAGAELIAQLRALLELNGRVKQPWTYEKLEKATIAALPRLLELAEQGLKAEGVKPAEPKSEQPADNGTKPDFHFD